MIINNKENNKGEQHPHIPNEHPTRHSPPSEELEGDFSSVRHSPPFGGVGGGFTTSYAASSVRTLTVQPCVHQEGLLLQYICLLHQNNS